MIKLQLLRENLIYVIFRRISGHSSVRERNTASSAARKIILVVFDLVKCNEMWQREGRSQNNDSFGNFL